MDKYIYFIDNKIYVNLTNKCSNNCDFCVRRYKNRISDIGLWIKNVPSAEEVISQLPENLDDFDSEVVFCGFGEPTYNLDALEEVAAFLHCIGKTTRINTNGQADLIHSKDVSDIVADSCDVINISLNAPTREKYHAVCKSSFGEKAFDSLLEFAENLKKRGANVAFSVVNSLCESDLKDCQKLAMKMGIPLKVRTKEK